MAYTSLFVLLVVFVATLIRSTFGFGEALVSVPLLALMLPVTIVTPLVVLLSISIALVVVVQDWRKIQLRSTGLLLIPTVLGIPLGVALLSSAHEHAVKAVLSVTILVFSGYSLLGRRAPELRSDSLPLLLGCGFLAGILGGAYGMNGPPLVVYGAMRRWSPQHFRATLQGYFLPAGLLAISWYWWSGLWVPAVTHYFWISLPVAFPAIFIGRALNYRLRGEAFIKYIHAALICLALVLLVQVLRHV